MTQIAPIIISSIAWTTFAYSWSLNWRHLSSQTFSPIDPCILLNIFNHSSSGKQTDVNKDKSYSHQVIQLFAMSWREGKFVPQNPLQPKPVDSSILSFRHEIAHKQSRLLNQCCQMNHVQFHWVEASAGSFKRKMDKSGVIKRDECGLVNSNQEILGTMFTTLVMFHSSRRNIFSLSQALFAK